MIAGRLRLLLLPAAPALLAAAFAAAAALGWGPAAAVTPAERADELRSWFDDLLAEAGRLTDAPDASAHTLLDRLEGVAVIGGDGEISRWTGRPAEPPEGFSDPATAAWRVRDDGVHVRLLVRVGGEPVRMGSFVLDSRLEELSFQALIPPPLRRGVQLWFDFRDPVGPLAGPGSALDVPADAHRFELRSPDGDPIAAAALLPAPLEIARARLRAAGLAWAAVLLVVLASILVDWRRAPRSARGLVATWLALCVGRALLLRAGVATTLLPRELGTASLYGSSAAGGLFASPVDLLLTALTLLSACLALASWARTQQPRIRSLAGVTGGVAVTLGVVALLDSVSRNSRVPLLDHPGIWDWGGSTPVTLALVLMILAAAELFGLAWNSWRGTRGRLPVAVIFLGLAVAATFSLDRLSRELARERLRTDLAPQILRQSTQRRLALTDALRYVADYYRDVGPDEGVAALPPETLAYEFWVAGELFLSGYKSSLDFYDADGEPVSHFGFDVPPLDEIVAIPLDPADAPAAALDSSEVFGLTSAVSRRLIHAERPLVHRGVVLGAVVGHVLDEPDNLPFLPGSQPYLAALGAGGPRGLGEDLWGGPDYVIFDPRGRIVLDTMARPPALDDAIVRAARDGSTVEVRSGDQTYSGIALEDSGFIHVLLVPVRGWLERLAGSLRMAVVGLVLLALIDLLPRLARRGGARELLGSLRGSYYRKLLAAVLIASVPPLVGLSLFLRTYVARRAEASLETTSTRLVGAAGRALEDYAASLVDATNESELEINDDVLYWLRRVVGQDIHVYEAGRLQASSKRELFASGLLPPRLDGEIYRALIDEGRPYVLVDGTVGSHPVPVAHAQVFEHDPASTVVVAVPIVFEERQIARDVDRVAEMLLLATALLVALLAAAAMALARTVARPVRELAEATGRIAAGDYATRLRARTTDEVAALVDGFNSMAGSLAEQRADLERRKDYVETLLRHATTGVISTESHGRLVTLNPAARQLLGPTSEGLEEGAVLLEALDASRELRPFAEFLRNGPRHGEVDEIDLDGEGPQRRFRVVRVELPDPTAQGSSVGSLILVDDVTELMRSNQLSAWAEMARSIAHEIKNPLTPIQLSTEHLQRLLRDRGVLPSPELDACLTTVMKQVRSLYEIAGAFSAYAKLPQLTPGPTDPADFMRETVEPYRVGHPPGVTIEEDYEATGLISIDAKVLARAVVNLIENALHAMPQGGNLACAVAWHAGSAGRVALSVSDSGHGLTPEVRRRLFEPYFSTRSGGTGLGLAIVRRVVEAHDGTIEVEDRPGGGTTFRIVLPLAR